MQLSDRHIVEPPEATPYPYTLPPAPSTPPFPYHTAAGSYSRRCNSHHRSTAGSSWRSTASSHHGAATLGQQTHITAPSKPIDRPGASTVASQLQHLASLYQQGTFSEEVCAQFFMSMNTIYPCRLHSLMSRNSRVAGVCRSKGRGASSLCRKGEEGKVGTEGPDRAA